MDTGIKLANDSTKSAMAMLIKLFVNSFFNAVIPYLCRSKKIKKQFLLWLT